MKPPLKLADDVGITIGTIRLPLALVNQELNALVSLLERNLIQHQPGDKDKIVHSVFLSRELLVELSLVQRQRINAKPKPFHLLKEMPFGLTCRGGRFDVAFLPLGPAAFVDLSPERLFDSSADRVVDPGVTRRHQAHGAML